MRSIYIIYLVTELGSFTQYSKTVSKPSGNKKLLFIFIGQLYPYILPERTEIAKDGIAVIVNNDNDLEELSSDQVKSIFTGDITDWEDVTK